MKRTRTVPAAPVRSASATWSLIEELVVDTLGSSSTITEADVRTELAAAAGVGRMLVAAGHLDKQAIVLVAPPVHLSIYTVSGTDALGEDDPGPVPGASTSTDWTLYLPSPGPMGPAVSAAADGHPNISAEAPPTDEPTQHAATIDREALSRRNGDPR